MENIGCAHAFVGNSCPDVYQTGRDTFVVVTPGYNEETDKELPPEGNRVAGVCTDAWWYSIVDGDEFTRRNCEEEYDVEKVEVRPGVYQFTHFMHIKEKSEEKDDSSKPFIYTEIRWIRQPDPVRDYQKEWSKKNLTAGQIIYNLIERFPTLYDGDDAVQKAANKIFFIGRKGDWHENGFVQYDAGMKADAPSVDIPVFDKPYRWNTHLDLDSLPVLVANGSNFLNPSFLELAINVVRYIAKHGANSGATDANTENEKRRAKTYLGKLIELSR